MYEEGRPSNDLAEAGLMVHQHDNTEGWNDGVYRPQEDSGFASHWSMSFISRQYPGTYNKECGIIVNTTELEVECSYYHDMISWSTGCGGTGMEMDQPPSKPSGTPYPPEKLKDMLEMSAELQQRGAHQQLRRSGSGEPDPLIERNGRTFWQGQYNEIVINPATYVEGLPWSVAAVFAVNVSAGGDPEGANCARNTRMLIAQAYGIDESQIPLLIYTPNAKSMHAFTAPSEPKPSGPPSCPKCASGNNCCGDGGSWFNNCDGNDPSHTWQQGWAACNCADMTPTDGDWSSKCAPFGFKASEPGVQ